MEPLGDGAMQRASLYFVLFFILQGCSSAPYQDATAKLSKGLSAAETSLAALDYRDKMAAAIVAYEQPETKLVLGSCKIKPRDNDRNCALFIDEHVAKPQSRISRGLLLAKVLARYGKGLNDLAEAKDVNSLNSTLGEIDSSVTDAAKAAGTALPSYIAPLEVWRFLFWDRL